MQEERVSLSGSASEFGFSGSISGGDEVSVPSWL